MNAEESWDREDECLHQLLQTWRIENKPPPYFQERVWRRISLREDPQPAVWKLWSEFTIWCGAASRQPAMAAAYLAVVVATGAGLGYWKSERYVQQTELGWRAAYLQSVNPYAASFSK
jgi:hypothetical protein